MCSKLYILSYFIFFLFFFANF